MIAYDQDGETILGESQKMINYYKFDREPYEQNHMGDMQNNYKLIVNIDAKTYKMGEKIQINIEPYVKGASVLITAERGDQIIESFEMVLDGSPILIPVRESFLPNVNFSVIQIIGEQIALSEKRKEPRFFI